VKLSELFGRKFSEPLDEEDLAGYEDDDPTEPMQGEPEPYPEPEGGSQDKDD
jgi:hypothetical protein